MHGPITPQELDARRGEILDAIAQHGDVWTVSDGLCVVYILGPEPLLARVLGLHDAEYGWPVRVADDAPIEAFAPGLRRHPFIHRGGRPVAVAVSEDEYADILKKSD